MGKKRPSGISKKDLKHLKDFGEAHPADVESKIKRKKFENDTKLGVAQRRIIKAKSREKPNFENINFKNSKNEEKIIEESSENSESDEEINPEEAFTRGDLLELLKRETEQEKEFC